MERVLLRTGPRVSGPRHLTTPIRRRLSRTIPTSGTASVRPARANAIHLHNADGVVSRHATGKVNVTVVPRPGALSSRIAPCCASTRSRQMASPRPLPVEPRSQFASVACATVQSSQPISACLSSGCGVHRKFRHRNTSRSDLGRSWRPAPGKADRAPPSAPRRRRARAFRVASRAVASRARGATLGR